MIHSLHSFSSLILFRSFSSLILLAHSLRSLSSRTLSTQIAFWWTSWKPCRFVHPGRISVDKLETLPRFVHPDRFWVDKVNTALNHPIYEYAELLSFFPFSLFRRIHVFSALASFMLNVFLIEYQFLPVAGPFIVFFSEAFCRRFSRNYWESKVR